MSENTYRKAMSVLDELLRAINEAADAVEASRSSKQAA